MSAYSKAKTVAPLYKEPSYVHPDFEHFLNSTSPDQDISALDDQTPEKIEFFKSVFSTKFHVVYGRFDAYPYGPGNYLMLQFLQTPGSEVPDELQFVQFGRGKVVRQLGTQLNVTESSITFTGSSFEVVFRKTDHMLDGVYVWNLTATNSGRLEYNYYLVPIQFPLIIPSH